MGPSEYTTRYDGHHGYMKEEQIRGGSKPNEREMMALRPCCYVKKQTAGGNRGWVEIIENGSLEIGTAKKKKKAC